jgi:hypothetical protein
MRTENKRPIEREQSARPGSNRRQSLGRARCYHYTTGAEV